MKTKQLSFDALLLAVSLIVFIPKIKYKIIIRGI